MKKNLFGTDGIRAHVGTHPLTQHELIQLGQAIGQWAVEKYGTASAILIGHDTRISCSWIKAALQTGMLTHNLILEDAHVLPTPAVARLIHNSGLYRCGIIISASHNPFHDNGIKIIDAKNGKISAADEHRITELFNNNAAYKYNYGITRFNIDAQQEYIDQLISFFPPSLLHDKKIVLDCAHGATSSIASTIFNYLGARVITINNSPNGTNINDNCGALHIEQLQQTVVNHQANIGFAFDGDGDRVIAVNSLGQIKDGDDMIALLSSMSLYKASSTFVGTVMSNQGLEVFLNNNNKNLIRAHVGDKYVAEQLELHKALVGGEQSGHIILNDYLTTGDGIFAALRTCQTLQETDNWQMNTFTKYPQVLLNIRINTKKDLSLSPYAELIEESKLNIGSGRILVRYSGTEPLLRIMTEAPDYQTAHDVAHKLSQQLSAVLS